MNNRAGSSIFLISRGSLTDYLGRGEANPGPPCKRILSACAKGSHFTNSCSASLLPTPHGAGETARRVKALMHKHQNPSQARCISSRLGERPCLKKKICEGRSRKPSNIDLWPPMHTIPHAHIYKHRPIHQQKPNTHTHNSGGKGHEEPVSLSQSLNLHFSLASTGALFSHKTNRCHF